MTPNRSTKAQTDVVTMKAKRRGNKWNLVFHYKKALLALEISDLLLEGRHYGLPSEDRKYWDIYVKNINKAIDVAFKLEKELGIKPRKDIRRPNLEDNPDWRWITEFLSARIPHK